MFSVGGLVSGLDTNRIIEGLLAIQQNKINLLQNNRDRVTLQQTAFKGIEAKLLALQSQLTQLGRSQNGVFDLRTVTSSNQDLLTAAASSTALPGVYNLQVNSVARAHQVASQGFDGPNSQITQGTLQMRLGTGATTTITIDGTNNTLQGLANAINNSGAGVTATIVNDGSSSGTQPYRLMLTSNRTGASNAITFTNNLAGDSGGAVKPVFDATYIGAANTDANYTGTAVPTSNYGAGGFTGTSNNTYRFTVTNGGTVGIDNNITLSWVDSNNNTGTITLNSGDVNVFKNVAQGIQVKFNAGTLISGQTFSIKGFAPTVQQASNASVTLGSGSAGLTVQSATNQIDGVIPGVTLNVLGADPTRTVTLTVGNDTDRARHAILDFVDAYNGLMKSIDDQVRFDPTTGRASPLLGERAATVIQDQVRSVMGNVVDGVNLQMNRLRALGITMNDQGRLDVNQVRLDDVLAGRVSGVSLNDVRSLFALTGTSGNPGVQFVTGSTRTKASTTPYQVNITQAAQQGAITATNSLADSIVINGTNNTFTIMVDGATSSTITLAPGTYTKQTLAQEVQAEINANSSLPGRQVAVSLNGNQLVITSNSYGSSSKVTIGTGNALATLGFAGTETGQGRDVVGNFIVNGVVESAVGTGQFLVGSPGNANTADLQVRVTLNSSQIGSGVVTNLTVTRGLASRLDVTLNSLLDPVTGRMKSIDDGYQSTIDDIQKEITRQNQFIEARRQDLLRQFAAMEVTISQLQTAGTFLSTQQLTFPQQQARH